MSMPATLLPSEEPRGPRRPGVPRRFVLVKSVDHSGVSGTGLVAEGTQFSDGSVALRWTSQWPTTSVWASIEDMTAVHGHDGDTHVHWLDKAFGEGHLLSVVTDEHESCLATPP